MSKKDCKHTNNANYNKLKDSIRNNESIPKTFFCSQCTSWLNQNQINDLWNRGKKDIRDEEERMKERMKELARR